MYNTHANGHVPRFTRPRWQYLKGIIPVPPLGFLVEELDLFGGGHKALEYVTCKSLPCSLPCHLQKARESCAFKRGL